MGRWQRTVAWIALVLGLVGLVAWGARPAHDSQRAAPLSLADLSATAVPSAVRTFLAETAGFRAGADDRIEIWVCQVPPDTTDPTYVKTSQRLDLDPDRLTAQIGDRLSAYFAILSHHRYRPTFVPGGRYEMQSAAGPDECAAGALDRSDAASTAVLAVADAEHAEGMSGGFGSAGDGCANAPCSAAESRRWAYVGASDFHPDWGSRPPLDLVEHELGHTLGWPHSGDVPENGYASGLDVMSNSAAPREIDPEARDGQGTLGVNLLAAGWLPSSDVLVASQAGEYDLLASNAAVGPRLLLLPVDRERFLAVELLAASGLDRHLPRSGVTITLIDVSAAGCEGSAADACDPDQRIQRTVVGRAPFYDVLSASSHEWFGFDWRVRVATSAFGASVTAR